MPQKKYSPGHEILEHSERVARHWNLTDKGLFRTQVSDLTWNEGGKRWTVSLTENRGPGHSLRHLKVEAQYFIVASGVLSRPQVPKVPGLDCFAGHMFHTSRWDWKVTGGTPTDEHMGKLKDKRVGVIGTGATAIQVVPSLARYAKDLYVFQRTPSAVHRRDQRATDPHEWKTQIAAKKGWQEERMVNFTSYVCRNEGRDALNLVDDEWSKIDAYHAQLGSTRKPPVAPTPEAIGAHVAEFVGMDLPQGEAARKRVDSIVKDKETAAKLKPWYPSWCKRPTFSDEYLQAFNLPNVHLVDTDGRGIESATENGLVFGGKEYPLDVLVLSTGFVSPSAGGGDPALRSGIQVLGRNGLAFQDKWKAQGATTLHGILSHDFPNLFFLSPLQAGSAPNNVHMLDVQARQIGYVLGQARSRKAATVEASAESEEAWSLKCMSGAAWYAPISMCTPGYMTNEGEDFGKQPEPAEAMKKARASPWSGGLLSYDGILAEWREKGDLAGIAIKQ
jgi:cation diffusion facilitator CzcD-associated flavoprotein CzcO